MPEFDHALEDWIRRHQDWSDARLRKTVAGKVHHCVDYQGSLELLDRREKKRREDDHREAERRHQESLGRAEIAIRYAKWAMISAVVGVAVGIVGTSLPFAARTPARTDAPLPSTSLGSATDPLQATASKPATTLVPLPPIPKPDEKPKAIPTPPKK